MKKHFTFSLRGADWWKPFLVYWVIYAVLYAATVLLPRWMAVTAHPFGYFLIVFVLIVAQLLDQIIFLIVALRIVVPKVSIDGKGFQFRGSVGTFVGISIVGFLLTLITATVYAPWFVRRITSYLVSEITFDGTPPEFLGRGGKLFVYMLLALWLPLIVVIALSAVIIGVSAGGGSSVHPAAVTGITYAVMIVIFIVTVPFVYLAYKWYVNIRWNDTMITWQTRFWPSVGFILGQLLLTIITLSIYWPAAVLRVFRYFAGKTVLRVGERETGRLGFDGSIGKGFGLLWGQALLSIITAGVYIPWAVSRVYGWMLGASYVESQETPG